jgi:diacylglycerol kinase (ATP)
MERKKIRKHRFEEKSSAISPVYHDIFIKFVTRNSDGMKKRIQFIINPISGTSSKDRVPETIERYIDRENFDYEIKFTEYAGHARDLSKDAANRGVDIVVAVGGDGTVNEVGSGIVHTPTALGIIPYGSGNGLARHLLIPLNIKKSVEIINRCEIHSLDYGVINDHPFFCTCGMGFDAFVSMKFAETGKRGPITYIQKVLEEGARYKPETYEITEDSDTSHYKAFLISCANASQYGNNAYIAPQASMSDGLMDVIIMEPFDVIEAPQIAIDMFSKTLNKNSKIKTFKTKQLHIRRSQPGVIHYDGDPVMTGTDINVHIEEKGIRIIVNPDGDKSLRKPNAIQSAAADLFNEINDIRSEIAKQTQRGIALTKLIQKKIEKRLPNI